MILICGQGEAQSIVPSCKLWQQTRLENGSDATKPSPYSCQWAFSIMLAKLWQQRLAKLPIFRGGWSKKCSPLTYFIPVFVCFLKFFKAFFFLFFCAGWSFSKYPFVCYDLTCCSLSCALEMNPWACGCCSVLQAATELSNGKNDMVAIPHQNNTKITKHNSKSCLT